MSGPRDPEKIPVPLHEPNVCGRYTANMAERRPPVREEIKYVKKTEPSFNLLNSGLDWTRRVGENRCGFA